MQLLMRGVKIARDILRQQPFAPHGLSEILPGDGVTNDAELTAFIRENAMLDAAIARQFRFI